jgi:hypothetical protein
VRRQGTVTGPTRLCTRESKKRRHHTIDLQNPTVVNLNMERPNPKLMILLYFLCPQ